MAVTNSGAAVVTLPTDTQILITREFDAPKRLVYRAYATPELIQRWWSGDGAALADRRLLVSIVMRGGAVR